MELTVFLLEQSVLIAIKSCKCKFMYEWAVEFQILRRVGKGTLDIIWHVNTLAKVLEEKGVKEIEKTFFDEDNSHLVAQYFSHQKYLILKTTSKKAYCVSLYDFFEISMEQVKEICDNLKRKKKFVDPNFYGIDCLNLLTQCKDVP